MKRNAKQSGSGGRLRLGLLLACAAAFLLAPASQAFAAGTVTVVGAGGGSGEVTSGNALKTYKGTPPLECHWNGTSWNIGTPSSGECTNELSNEGEGIEATFLNAAPDNGSEFAGWTVVSGNAGQIGCLPGEKTCGPYAFAGEEASIVVEAEFVPCTEGSKVDTCVSTIKVNLGGIGTGKVVGKALFGQGLVGINCSNISGEESAECEASMVAENNEENKAGERYAGLNATAAAGAEFVEWTIQEGKFSEFICGPKPLVKVSCLFAVSERGEDAEVTAIFDAPPPPQKLTLTTSGSGSGSFECDTGSGPEACEAEYPEGTEVEVIPVADPGSEFVEFNAENGGECAGSECTVEMTGERTVNAQFDLKTYPLTITPIENGGTGSLECDVNGGGLGACPAEVTHGDEVEVVASAGAESEVNTISGPGSCEVAGDRQSGSCAFTVSGPSTVEAEFVSEGKIEKDPGNVYGEVDLQTTLETENCDNVNLGPFVPSSKEEEYSNDECVVTVTATGAENELRAADETGGLGGTDETGHLTQEPTSGFTLNNALEVEGTGTTGGASPNPSGFLPLSSAAIIQDYSTPVSLDVVTVEFLQRIDAFEPLHTGTYSKTITLTLEQTVL